MWRWPFLEKLSRWQTPYKFCVVDNLFQRLRGMWRWPFLIPPVRRPPPTLTSPSSCLKTPPYRSVALWGFPLWCVLDGGFFIWGCSACLHLSVSVCLCLSVCLSVCLSLSLSLSLSLCVYLTLSLSFLPSLSLSLCPLSLSAICLYLHSPSLSRTLSFWLSLSFDLSLPSFLRSLSQCHC